ncbi:tetratricopeptide repeat protein [Flavobacterium antarcticum]
MLRKLLVLWIIFFLYAPKNYGQQKQIDSLKILLQQYESKNSSKRFSAADSTKVQLLELLSDYTFDTQPDVSLAYTRKALQLSNTIHYSKGILYNNYILGMYYSNTGDYLLALKHLKTCDSVAKRFKNKIQIANISNEKGIVYSKMSNYPEATKHTLAALNYYEKLGDLQMYGNGLINMGILYKHQNKFDKAFEYYEKALKVYDKVDKDAAHFAKAAIYSNMGQAYLKMGNKEKAIEAINQSQVFASKAGSPYLNAENSHTLAATFFRKKDYKKAIYYYEKALQSYDSINDKSGISKTKIHLGSAFFSDQQTANAFKYNAEGLALAKAIQNLEWQKDAYENRAEMFVKQNNFKAAFENQVLFKQINDSMFNASQAKKITEMQMQYGFDQLQQKSENLQKQKIAKLNNEANRLRFIRNGAIGFSIVLLLLFGIIFYNLQKVKKQRKVINLQKAELETKNQRIQDTLSEKEVLLKEIHHRVKNNLQIVSSLLNIQAQNISDVKVLESIKEGQSRVQAMSLIHQNLYQSEELDAINIENYLQQLTAYLRDIFAGKSKDISVSIETSELYFDIDTAIPLGLIVNELVSNAFKYAFAETEKGMITISIDSVDGADYQLTVKDNGRGLPDDFQIKNSKSLGLKLVTILSRQLRGSMVFTTLNGSIFTIKFKDLKVFNSLRHSNSFTQ